jgi:hypothetical protein
MKSARADAAHRWRRRAAFAGRVALAIGLAAPVFAPCGCRSPEPAEARPAAGAKRADEAPEPAPRGTPPRLERVGRDTFIYRLQYERAEETAETLRPLLERHFGREVLIVPHRESNCLIIRIPRDRGASGLGQPPNQRPLGNSPK